MGICEVLIALTNSPSSEVRGNGAAALGNLSSRDARAAADDYSAFNEAWDKPEGGMHNYLYRFLTSPDRSSRHVAVWTIVQLLESGDPQLINNIRSSPLLAPHIRQLAAPRSSTPNSDGTPLSVRSRPGQETDTTEGEEEIQVLSGRILELIDRDDTHSTAVAPAPSQSPFPFASLLDKVNEDLWSSIQEALP